DMPRPGSTFAQRWHGVSRALPASLQRRGAGTHRWEAFASMTIHGLRMNRKCTRQFSFYNSTAPEWPKASTYGIARRPCPELGPDGANLLQQSAHGWQTKPAY